MSQVPALTICTVTLMPTSPTSTRSICVGNTSTHERRRTRTRLARCGRMFLVLIRCFLEVTCASHQAGFGKTDRTKEGHVSERASDHHQWCLVLQQNGRLYLWRLGDERANAHASQLEQLVGLCCLLHLQVHVRVWSVQATIGRDLTSEGPSV